MPALKRLYTFLSSIRFAVILIAFIALTSAIATGIPQSRPSDFYLSQFEIFGRTMLLLGFHHFFRSLLFLLPLSLFFLNLLLCTIKRIRRHRNGEPLTSYGPDVIHVGILMLIVAGLMTLAFREERQIVLAEGQSAQLPGDYLITLLSFNTVLYADDSPRNWQSELELSHPEKPTVIKIVAVNAPLRVGSMRLYQYSYGREMTAIVNSEEWEIDLAVGDRFSISDDVYDVLRIDTESRTLTVQNEESGATTQLSPGAKIGDGQVHDFSTRQVSVLLGVQDLGLLPAAVSLTLVILGLGITFGRKILSQIREDQ